MNIYLQDLRSLRKSVLIWAASLSFVVVFYMALYPTFSKDSRLVAAVMSNLPQSAKDMMGISPETFTTMLGFYTFTLTYLILCGAVQAMNTGMGVLAKEASGKTADFLLTKPVSRANVLSAKLLAALTALAFTSIVVLAVALLMASSVSAQALDYALFLKLSLPLFFVQVIFAVLGFFIAAIAPKIKAVLPLSLSIVFLFFIIGLIQSALKYKDLRFLTPFKYFDLDYILVHASYEGIFAAFSMSIIAVSVTLSFLVYINKDISAA